MNTIHQISLKLRMGIHPATQIHPELLRAMWHQLIRERAEALKAQAGKMAPTSLNMHLPGKLQTR
jgi:hypothetical protein